MLLYKSHYLTVNMIEIRYFIHLQWTKPADLLDEVGIYGEIAKFYQKRIKRRGRLILWDFKVIENRIDKKFFDWVISEILPQICSVKISRIAFLVNNPLKFGLDKEFLTINNKQVEFKTFADQTQAMNWLMEKAEMKQLGSSSHHHH